MFAIGDIHGKWDAYFKLIKKLDRKSIQVGDFGFGFLPDPPPWDDDHMFIRGNHDSPEACRKHPNYLGDFGVTDDGIFFVSGAYSVDRMWRTIGIDWWEDEELSEEDGAKVLELYKEVKPKIVVAHDCPAPMKEYVVDRFLFDNQRFINRTSDGLMTDMIAVHKPELWVFGHYHCSTVTNIDGVQYVSLNELEIFEFQP